jgi:hypothetical protein
MKKTRIPGLTAATVSLIPGNLARASTPASTRTLTRSTGNGTPPGRAQSSHPCHLRTLDYPGSGHADRRITNFANRSSHRAAVSCRPGSEADHGQPASIPKQTVGHIASTIGASSRATIRLSPASPASIPDQAAGHMPDAIGGRPGQAGSRQGSNRTRATGCSTGCFRQHRSERYAPRPAGSTRYPGKDSHPAGRPGVHWRSLPAVPAC